MTIIKCMNIETNITGAKMSLVKLRETVVKDIERTQLQLPRVWMKDHVKNGDKLFIYADAIRKQLAIKVEPQGVSQ